MALKIIDTYEVTVDATAPVLAFDPDSYGGGVEVWLAVDDGAQAANGATDVIFIGKDDNMGPGDGWPVRPGSPMILFSQKSLTTIGPVYAIAHTNGQKMRVMVQGG